MFSYLGLILLILYQQKSTLAQCQKDLHETICANITFNDDTTLDRSENHHLVIANSSGSLSSLNFANYNINLEQLTITHSNLNEIKNGAFSGIKTLTKLNILNKNKHQFPTITNKILEGCTSLKQAIFDGITFENNAFEHSPSLETLQINASILPDKNQLKKTFFSGLKLLKSLTISHTHLEEIEADTFQDLPLLKTLDLQENNLKAIPAKLFNGLEKLQVLNLAQNEINTLTWDEFAGLKSLRVLYLEGNSFKNIDIKKLTTNLPDLERIFFNGNQLDPENRKQVEDILSSKHITFIYIGPIPLF